MTEPRSEMTGFKLTKTELEALTELKETMGFRTMTDLLRALVFGALALAERLTDGQPR